MIAPPLPDATQASSSSRLLRCCSFLAASLALARCSPAEKTIDYDRATLYTALPILTTTRTLLQWNDSARDVTIRSRLARRPNWRNGQGRKPKIARPTSGAIAATRYYCPLRTS